MKPEDQPLPTRWTLVNRIKDPGDQESWREFYDLYRGLVLGVAIKAGLTEDEAKDVLQATMASVSKNIGEFEADPERGSFSAWLLKVARWRIKDQYAKRLPVAARSPGFPDATATTPTVERVADPREVDLAGLCDAERDRWFRTQALRTLQLEVKAEHYQIFHLLVVEEKTVAEVARMLGRSRAQIYLIKHRVANVLKKIAKRREAERW